MDKQKGKEPSKQGSRSKGPQGKFPQPGGTQGPAQGGLSWGKILLFAVILSFLLNWGLGVFNQRTHIPYSKFRSLLQKDRVAEITARGSRIHGTLSKEAEIQKEEGQSEKFKKFVTYFPKFGDEKLTSLLEEKKVTVNTQPERGRSWLYILLLLAPLLLIGGLFYMQYKRMQGSAGGIFNIGKSRAKRHTVSEEKTTFQDVAGAESAKEELREVVSYLKNPERIRQLGGNIPRGMLLLGPPGCGKTLLARAVAGEAQVPFYSITGSDFMEMFVGIGASRVRDLFKQAKSTAPSIIFIDELDSIGRQRGAGLSFA